MLRGFLANRRRAQAIRTVEGLRPVRSVLVLCTANRVRSPYAAAYLATQLPPEITVRSRGVLAGGHPATLEAVMLAAELQLNLNLHESRQLKPADLIASQLVLVMEDRMRSSLGQQYPAVRNQLVLLGDLDPKGEGRDIADPYDLTMADYRASYDRIRRCADALVQVLHSR